MKRCLVILMCLVFVCGWVIADTKSLPAKKQTVEKIKKEQVGKTEKQPPDAVREYAPTLQNEELFQRILELKEQDLYDEDLWNQYFRLTAPRLHPGNRLDDGGDSCHTAVEITSLPFSDTGSTCGGTNQCGNPSKDVFYKYTVPSEQMLTISLCGSSYDTFLRVWSDCCVNEIIYNDEGSGLQSEITYCFQPGDIWIQVEGYDTECGSYTLNVTAEGECPPPPDNGTCETATVIPSLPYSDFSTTCGGGDECGYSFEDVFYKYTVPSPDELLRISVTGTNAYFYVWSACCDTLIIDNYSDYIECFPAGDIWIQVESYSGCAPFTLEVTSGGPCDEPDNGTCETATVIPSLPYSDYNTTIGGGNECGYELEDVFYKYTVPSSGEMLIISTTGSGSVYFTVWSECCVTQLATADDDFPRCYPAGDIWIMIEAYCDVFSIEVTSLGSCPPPADNGTCETATVIPSLPYSDSAAVYGGGDICGSEDCEDVFYKYTAPESGEYLKITTTSLQGSYLYTYVWDECCESLLIYSYSGEIRRCFAGDIWIMIEGVGCALYDLNVESLGECPPCWDMTMDAPGTITGNISGAGDDCNLSFYEDIVVKVNIPNDGNWTFSLESSDYGTYIGVGTDCCLGDICTDVGGERTSVCANIPLTAGEYYVTVEASPTREEGKGFSLTVEENPAPEPCPCEGDLFMSDALGLPIPDDGLIDPCEADGGVSHTITIPPTSAVVTDVNVNVNITHTCVGDFAIRVSHEDVDVVLKTMGGTDCNDIITTFDDEGEPWDDSYYGCPNIGCFQTYDVNSCGNNLLSAFDGLPVEGDWTIYVADGAGEDTGTLDDWGLCIMSEETGCVPDPLSLTFDPADGLPQCSCLFVCPEDSTLLCVGPGLGPEEQPVLSFTPGCASVDVPGCPPVDAVLGNWEYHASNGTWCNHVWAEEDEGCVLVCLDDYLAVELVDFDAVPGDRSVTLNWTTATETDNDYFEILRDGQITGRVEGTNSSGGSSYSWTDENLNNGQFYSYTLFAVDLNGARQELGTVEATPSFSEAVITEYALHQNYPNPFNPMTSISFDLLESGFVSLKVYNLLGQEVAALVNQTMTSGRHFVNFHADALPSGVYLYRLEAGDFTAQKKMILMK